MVVSGAVRWVGKTLVVGVIVALTLTSCSGEATRSALGEDAAQADTAASQDTSPSPIPTPDDSDVAVAEPSSASASTPALGASPEVQSSEDANGLLGVLGGPSVRVCVVNGTSSPISAGSRHEHNLRSIPPIDDISSIPPMRDLRHCVNNRTVKYPATNDAYDITLWFRTRYGDRGTLFLTFQNPTFARPYVISNATRDIDDPRCWFYGYSAGWVNSNNCWQVSFGQREHRWVKDSWTEWCLRVSREANDTAPGIVIPPGIRGPDRIIFVNFRVVVLPSTHPCEGP